MQGGNIFNHLSTIYTFWYLFYLCFMFRLNEEISTMYANSTKFSTERDELTQAYQKTIDRLESDLKEQKALTHEANQKLAAHDTAAKRAILVLQKEMGAKVEQVSNVVYSLYTSMNVLNHPILYNENAG